MIKWGDRIIGGGGGVSKTVFGEGFYGMFSPLLTFPPPLFLSEFCLKSGVQNCEKVPARNS